MKVSDLKIGRLYKIRSDRPTNVIVGSNNTLDIHLGHGVFKENSSLVKTSVILYVSRNNGRRWVCYNGKKLWVFPNAWQHIEPLSEE